MIAKLSADLTARILDQVVLDRVRMITAAGELPELEEDLIEVIDQIRQAGDPPSKHVAVHLILAALRAHDDELAEQARAMRVAHRGAS